MDLDGLEIDPNGVMIIHESRQNQRPFPSPGLKCEGIQQKKASCKIRELVQSLGGILPSHVGIKSATCVESLLNILSCSTHMKIYWIAHDQKFWLLLILCISKRVWNKEHDYFICKSHESKAHL